MKNKYKKITISKEKLEKMLLTMNIGDCAKWIGASTSGLRSFAKRNGVSHTRKREFLNNAINISYKDFCEEIKTRSYKEIAYRLCCSLSGIKGLAKKYGIVNPRKSGERVKR